MLCGSRCSLGTAPGGFCREKLVLLLPGLANRPHGLQLDQRQRGPCAQGPARCPAALPPEQAVNSMSVGVPLPTGGPGRRRCGTPNGATRGAREWGTCWWRWVAPGVGSSCARWERSVLAGHGTGVALLALVPWPHIPTLSSSPSHDTQQPRGVEAGPECRALPFLALPSPPPPPSCCSRPAPSLAPPFLNKAPRRHAAPLPGLDEFQRPRPHFPRRQGPEPPAAPFPLSLQTVGASRGRLDGAAVGPAQLLMGISLCTLARSWDIAERRASSWIP